MDFILITLIYYNAIYKNKDREKQNAFLDLYHILVI